MMAKLQAMLGMDASKFNASTKKAGNNVNKFGQGLGKIKGLIAGAFSIGIIVAFGRKMLKMADDLQTAANIFNVSIETMIAFQSVMAESGISAERFNKIFGRIASAQGDVRRGLATYVDAINDMNISSEEFVGIGVDKALELMAQKYGEAADKGKFMEGTVKLLGTRLVGLVEVFQRMNREGMDPFRKNAESAADGMRELAKASDKLEKYQNKLTITTGKFFGLIENAQRFWGAYFKGGMEEVARMKTIESQEKQIEALKRLTSQARAAKEAKDALAESRWKAEIKEEEELTKWAEKQADTMIKKAETAAKKRIKLEEKRGKIEEDYAKRAAAIRAGKGISAPGMARVSRLQAIGGVVGRAAGVGDQAARMAERQLAIQTALKTLTSETNSKIDENTRATVALGEE